MVQKKGLLVDMSDTVKLVQK